MSVGHGVHCSTGLWQRRATTSRLAAWAALVVGAMGLGGCRGRHLPRPVTTVAARDAHATVTVSTEHAALFVVAGDGGVGVRCLPDGSASTDLFPAQSVVRIFDSVVHDGSLRMAVLLGRPGGTAEHPNGQLGLLTPGAPARVLAEAPRYARFSPSGAKLLFETTARRHVGGGAMLQVPSTRVLDLASGVVEVIGDYADPRWEPDGRHVRATRLTAEVRDRRSHTTAGWRASRIRWDGESKSVDVEGTGGAQMPAPYGAGVAWTEAAPSPFASIACSLQWGAGQQRSAVGSFCQGMVDERSARWSPDGAWLAFAGIPADTDAAMPATELEVWSLAGGRHPAIAKLAQAPRHESLRWIEWSPSGRHLVAENAAHEIWLYDLQEAKAAVQGRGSRPRWSPAGTYLLLCDETDEATADPVTGLRVLPGPDVKVSVPALGRARDVAWAPAVVCSPPPPAG